MAAKRWFIVDEIEQDFPLPVFIKSQHLEVPVNGCEDSLWAIAATIQREPNTCFHFCIKAQVTCRW